MTKSTEQHFKMIANAISKLGAVLRTLRELEAAVVQMTLPIKIPAPVLPAAPKAATKPAKVTARSPKAKPLTIFRDALVATGGKPLSVSEAPRDLAELSHLGRVQLLQLGEQLRLFGTDEEEARRKVKGVSYNWLVGVVHQELARLDGPAVAAVPPSPIATVQVDSKKAHIRPNGDGRMRLTTPDGRTFVQKRPRDLKLLAKKLGFEVEILP